MIQSLFMSNEQTHPLHLTDKNIIDSLITKEKPEDLDFINLARLINRYNNFPGEIETQRCGRFRFGLVKTSERKIGVLRKLRANEGVVRNFIIVRCRLPDFLPGAQKSRQHVVLHEALAAVNYRFRISGRHVNVATIF